MKDLPARKPNRLKGYDYSQNGCYFITICVKDRRELFWHQPVGARIARPPLSDMGEVVRKAIENIPHIYKSITVDKYVIMPNHIHLILLISDDPGRAMRAPTISTVVNQMKGYVTKQVGYSIWQKLFHDHIIRNDKAYREIWQYIDENPIKWEDDCYNRGT
jgi:REP element-mobilizing transposase RayT